MSEPQVAAGWYPDPHAVSEQRWWDGTAWTNHVHPELVAAAAVAAAPVAEVTQIHQHAYTQDIGYVAGEAPTVDKAFKAGLFAVFFNVALVPSFLAIKWSRQAQAEIDESGGRLEGQGKVTAAKLMGWIGGILQAIVLVVVALGVISLMGTFGQATEYTTKVNAVLENAQFDALNNVNASPAETKKVLASLSADTETLGALDAPSKVAAEHDRLVAGMVQTVKGLEMGIAAASSGDTMAASAAQAQVSAGIAEAQQAAAEIDAKLE